MPFDALTIAAVADELREKAVGGRIQQVFLPAPLAVGLEIYSHHDTQYVFASAHPQHARVHLAQSKLGRGSDDVTPLLLLLRKYVRDGRLVAVEQPALERVLSLIIAKADVFDKGPDVTPVPELTTVRLIIEIMGRYSNIILVDEAGMVMEAVKHIPAELNRYRVTLPRHAYIPPPPQKKEDPRAAGVLALFPLLAASASQPAWRALVQSFAGISPLLAREAVYRASGYADAVCTGVTVDALASALSSLLSSSHTHQWAPTLAREGAGILDFAPYQLTQFGHLTFPAGSISAAAHAYYAQETVASDYAGIKQKVQKVLDQQRARITRRKESLERQQTAGTQADSLRTCGEMLLAYAAQVQPGQTELVVEAAAGGPPLHIALAPRLSAVENAQDYFRRYTQARDAARSVPPLLSQVALDQAFVDQLQFDLDSAKNPAEVRDIQAAMADTAADRKQEPPDRKGKAVKGKPTSKLPPLTYTAADGMEILVGRNARQNDYLTFELAASLDMWLHARGVAGSHVIVRSGGRAVSEETINQAAALAAAHSTAQRSAAVAVDYTQRRNVHRVKGGGPGLVTYLNEKTVHVRPALAPSTTPSPRAAER